MSKKSKDIADIVSRQGHVIRKFTRRGTTAKFNKSRVTLYHKGKYKGWVSKKEYKPLARESTIKIGKSRKYKGRHKVSFKAITFEKPVTVKTGKMKRSVTKTWKIKTYTKTQRKFVVQTFKRNKIPMNKKSVFQKLTDLRKNFKLLNISTSGFVKRS
jgi:hypothetical protein